MTRERITVLILHNAPRAAAGEGLAAGPGAAAADAGAAAPAFAESEAGVLAEVAAVATALRRLRVPHRVAAIASLADAERALGGSPERIVFNLVEGLPGAPDDVNLVPALCRAHGKECTGGDTPCLALTLDKWRTRAVLQASGLPVPRGALAPPGAPLGTARLPAGRLIAKPAWTDASEGIDADGIGTRGSAALRRAVRRIHDQLGQPALVEEFVDGREVNVSVWQRGATAAVLPLAEIDFSAFGPDRPRIVGYRAKWIEDSFEYRHTERVVPARLPARTAAAVRRLALAAWDACGCRDYARVDFRIRRGGAPVVLEVNANPDLSPDAGFPAALAAGGVAFHGFVDAMVANAAARLVAREKAAAVAGAGAAAHGAGGGSVGRAAAAGAGRRGASAGRGAARARQLIRHSVTADREAVDRLLAATAFFRPDELVVAREVLDEALAAGPEGHYQSFVIEDAGEVAGWICLGQTPCTLGTFDIYWLAVSPDHQGRGLGKALVRHAEELIIARGGRLSVIETSGSPGYTPTRQFYLGAGYYEAGRIPGFYAPGDDRIIYLKALKA